MIVQRGGVAREQPQLPRRSVWRRLLLAALGEEGVGLLRRGVELRLHDRRRVRLALARRRVEDVPEAGLVGVLDLAPLRDRRVRPTLLDGREELLVVVVLLADL